MVSVKYCNLEMPNRDGLLLDHLKAMKIVGFTRLAFPVNLR